MAETLERPADLAFADSAQRGHGFLRAGAEGDRREDTQPDLVGEGCQGGGRMQRRRRRRRAGPVPSE